MRPLSVYRQQMPLHRPAEVRNTGVAKFPVANETTPSQAMWDTPGLSFAVPLASFGSLLTQEL